MSFLSDKKLLMGIGIGIIFGTIVMTTAKIEFTMSKSQVESKARSMGMIYPEEAKVQNDKGVKK